MRVGWARCVLYGASVLACSRADAQFARGAAEWVVDGADAQRSHWIPADTKISRESVQEPGFQFLWKRTLENEAVQLNSLTPATLMDRYIGYRGFRSLAFLAGSANKLFAVDTDLNRIEWQTSLSGPGPLPGTPACPGGSTTSIARATTAQYPNPAVVAGGLGGRTSPARSGVGAANQGAVTIPTALAAIAAAFASGGPAGGPPTSAVIFYAVAADGTLRTAYISNGTESVPPIPFVPANASVQGFVVIGKTAYAATQDCNGSPSAVWALDLTTKQVTTWKPSKGSVAGGEGIAFGPDGVVYATTTAGDLVALDPAKLAVTQAFQTDGVAFTSSPVVFRYQDRDLVAAAAKDGRIYVFDSASLKTPLAKSQPYSANFAPRALSTWQSADGTRWLLAPVIGAPANGAGFGNSGGATPNGAVAAWKLSGKGDLVALNADWLSRDLISPLPPMILNGVVFAVSSGEYHSDDPAVTASQRAQRSSRAVIFALDGATGKRLWDSGKSITSFVHSGAISGGANQIYLTTYDENLYAFGFPIEH